MFRTPLGNRGRPAIQSVPPGYVNFRSGLIARHAAGARKVYVACEEDSCKGCLDSCQRRPVCQVQCMQTPRCNRHFLMEWEDSTTYKVNMNHATSGDQRWVLKGGTPVQAGEWIERFAENIYGYIKRQEREGF